ncbi:MAG: branched-chain amino acid transport system II carrier protein [Bacteroidetes bacterium]|jgi:LIVCS family branched-chain amino acid:cation transporter|nr:branched-chain amino acid transport system II carrier protein [Bacteroidota bacterium]MDB2471164.1 branched-chain amino acid transport system II carrier protein [Flavobacteriaceae bacterium]MDC3269320.1 branched-chain amino acid transport system II carrier protein [Flavobacteriaceae bacterium]
MNKTRETYVFGFAIFAAFFGAGNLILPPLLGFNAGVDWWLVALGFVLSAVVIPLAALLAHARLQGTMLDFGNKVSPLFSLLFSLCIYIIAVLLPVPRTAAVTHEMAIEPFFGTGSLLTSSVYFTLVFLFALNRGKVLDVLGKYLTPIIVIILLFIIGVGVFSESEDIRLVTIDSPFLNGFFEGYQTYDAIAGLLTGGVVVISLNLKGYTSFNDKRIVIVRSGCIAMFCLLIIYLGLIYLGATLNIELPYQISRSELLQEIAKRTLGKFGNISLSVLMSLACFTTAVAVIVGTADFFQGLFKKSKHVYVFMVLVFCLIGVFIGQLDVSYIIDVALPILMIAYPIMIVLIFLNVIPPKWASNVVFKAVIVVTIMFSLLDVLSSDNVTTWLKKLLEEIPFSSFNLGWLLPSMATFMIVNVSLKVKEKYF